MLQTALANAYPGRGFARLRLWMAFAQGLVASSGGEDTTRGRSFLFFALGVMAGTGLGREFTLQCPENGLIAINVPLDPIRLGALSTRTTHPFYIARWNQAMAALGITGRIENPYWDKTKGEMVADCQNPALLREVAPTSLSCSSPTKGRWQGLGVQHCGYCLPCLIRRGSLAAGFAPAPDPTVYTLDDLTARPLNTRESEGVQIRSFQLAIDRLRRRPSLAQLLIHKPGPLADESRRGHQHPPEWRICAVLAVFMDALPILVYKGCVQSDPYGHPFQRSSHRHFLFPSSHSRGASAVLRRRVERV